MMMPEESPRCDPSNVKVAVLGPLGTYTHEAAYAKFGDWVEYDEYRTISDVFRALSTSVPLGVVPQENSIFGNVIETYDFLRKNDAGFIRGEVILKVEHCLLVRKGVKIHEIQKVLSHEQALGQCQEFISANMPTALTVKMPSTASAARAVLESPPNCAAICSRICATLFDGLEVLYEGIQNDSMNFTRFYVIAFQRETPVPALLEALPDHALIRLTSAKFPAYFGQKNTCAKGLITLLDSLELDVTRIDRRPSPNTSPFHDTYFVEVQRECSIGHEAGLDGWTSKVEQAVQRVKKSGAEVDLIGIW